MKGTQKFHKVVLAYSGGLDTSVMLHWLKAQFDCEVVCYCADVGQGEELAGLEEKALSSGAHRVYIDDLQREFVSDFVMTAIKANAVYEGVYLMGTALARPLIAKRQIEIAHIEGAEAVAHGATGKGNDQVRFELTYAALDPEIQVIAPWRTWPYSSRTDLIEYAETHGIPVSASREKPYSIDSNLMHTSYEGGILEDPWVAPPEDIFTMTTAPEDAPSRPVYLEIGFEQGVPVRVNGQLLEPVELLTVLNRIGAEHGIGRVDLVENRFVGIKSRGVYETPGVTVLQAAHRALESITLDREVMHLRDSLGTRLSELVYNGFWYSPEFSLLRNLIDGSQRTVNGEVRLKLYKGNCTTVGRRSPNSLYSGELATFESDGVYDQKDAEGFIRLNALRLKLQAKGPAETAPLEGVSHAL